MRTPGKTRKQSATRIEVLRTIIDAPCHDPKCAATGTCNHEGYKDAARAHLARILGNAKEQASSAAAGAAYGSEEYRAAWAAILERGYDEAGNEWWEGPKHRRASHDGPVTYAQAIREEVKVARRAGRRPLVSPADGPAALSVQAVELFRIDPIGEAPAAIKISVRRERGGVDITVRDIPTDWGWHVEEHEGNDGRMHTSHRSTQELRELGRELRRVANSYNASYGSNIATDCFARAFTVSVTAESPRGWNVVL